MAKKKPYDHRLIDAAIKHALKNEKERSGKRLDRFDIRIDNYAAFVRGAIWAAEQLNRKAHP